MSSEERMLVFLRYVADPGFQHAVGVHKSTVSKTVYNVMGAIIRKTNAWIKFSTSMDDLQNEKVKWQEKYKFPSAIGAINCTHIPILKPSVHGDEYVNRKKFTSINVQATCNSVEEFTSLNVSWPGSVHDARIWKNSRH